MQKKIAITGATDGIGLATAKLLAEQGHHLLLHGRSAAKMENAIESILNVAPKAKLESYLADLSSIRKTKKFAADLLANHSTLDVLINNAGVLKTPNPITDEKLDARFVVNTISPYVLTRSLEALLGDTGRVVNLSSAAQQAVELDALLGEQPLDDDMAAYAQSKLALTMWTFALASASTSNAPTYIAVNPGSLLASKMVKQGFGVSGSDLGIGAEILCKAALSEEFGDASGRYFDNDKQAFSDPHVDALDSKKCMAIIAAIDQLLTRGN